MEKALYQSHGINYSEYERSLDKRLEVEKSRDKEHVECTQRLAASLTNSHR
jgi:hypothetical protein